MTSRLNAVNATVHLTKLSRIPYTTELYALYKDCADISREFILNIPEYAMGGIVAWKPFRI